MCLSMITHRAVVVSFQAVLQRWGLSSGNQVNILVVESTKLDTNVQNQYYTLGRVILTSHRFVLAYKNDLLYVAVKGCYLFSFRP